MIRGFLARKQHQPRIKGMVKIKTIRTNMANMEQIANQLKEEKESMLKSVKDIQATIENAVQTIKV